MRGFKPRLGLLYKLFLCINLRGYSLIGKTAILHIVILGSSPNISNVKIKSQMIINSLICHNTKDYVEKNGCTLYWISNIMSILCYIFIVYLFFSLFHFFIFKSKFGKWSFISYSFMYNNIEDNRVQIWKDNKGKSGVYR